MRDADVLEEVVVCETNQVPRCSFAPLVVVVCETKTRSFVFICTPLTATLVDGPCRPGNRECPPIIKESPQLPPIKIKMGGWTNSWKSFQFIFTNAAIESFFLRTGKAEIQPSLMPQSWFTRDEKEARQISVEIRFLLERRLISMGKWNSKKISMGKWKISMKKLKEDFHEKLKEDSWADARTSHAIENWQNNWL